MSDDYDVMEFDDDDLNFDDDSFDVSMDAPKDDRNPIAVARDAVLTNVKNDLTDTARITSTLRDSLPTGYGSAVTAVDTTLATTRELYNDAVKEVGPAVRDLKRQTKRALPRMKQYMPASWYDKAEKFLEDDEPQGQAQQDADGAAIASSLASIFEQQNETERTENLEQTAERTIEKKIDDTRHKEGASLQVGIINRLQQLIEYNNKIDSKVSRQGLELQFRSYFTLRDLLEVTTRTSTDTVQHLSDIVKNTGLPDLLKRQTSENALQLLEDSIYGRRVDDLMGVMEPYVAKLKGNMKERFSKLTTSFKSGLEGGSEMLGGINDASEMAAEFGGEGPGVTDIGAGIVSGNITERAFRRLGDMTRKVFDKDPTTTNSKLELAFSDIEGLASRLATSNKDDDVKVGSSTVPKWLQWIARTAADGMSGAVSEQVGSAVTNIRGKETDAVSYDVMTRKSIVEIIPYYLREQLSQLSILNGGDGEKHVYNPAKGRMDTMRSAVKDIRKEAYNADTERARLSSLKDTVNAMDNEGKMGALQKRKLAEIINNSAKDGSNFDAVELITVLETSGDPESVLMAVQLRESLGIAEDDTVKDSKATLGKLSKITRSFASVRKSYTGDRQKLLGDYARSGSNELLAEAGLLKDDGSRRGSSMTYNAERQRKYREQIIRTLFRGDVDDQPDNPNSSSTGKASDFVGPNRPEGPYRPYPNSPTKYDFVGPNRPEGPYRPSPVQQAKAAANYGQGSNAMQQGYGSQTVGKFGNDQAPPPPPGTTLSPAQKAKAAANYGQGSNAMQQGYGNQSTRVNPTVSSGSSSKPRFTLDTSSLRARGDTQAITIRDGIIEVSGATESGPSLERRQEIAKAEAEEKDKAEEPEAPEGIIGHLKELIAANTQGFVDTVEAIMASSPDDAEIRDRYFSGLRSRMGKRLKGVGSFLGGTFKTGLEVAKLPFKMASGILGGIKDVFMGERDIYVEGEGASPVLTVSKMQRGDYTDHKGDRLESLRNIKGPVFEGENQVLTLGQIDKGLYSKTGLGKKVSAMGDSAKGFIRRQFTNLFGRTVGRVLNFARARVNDVTGFAKKLGNRHLKRDLYLKGMLSKPVLTLANMKAGKYLDAKTGEVITSFSQIVNGIKDRDGNWLLQPTDLSNLVDINGRVLKVRGAIISAFKIISKPTRMAFGMVAKAAKHVNNKAMERLKTDVYAYGVNSKGENVLQVRLYHAALKRGEYYNQGEDGSIGMSLRSFAEIRGPIVDAKNKVLLTGDEIKAGLFDSQGKRLIIAGTLMYLAKSAKNLITTPIAKVANMVKGVGKWLFGDSESKGKESLLGKLTGFLGGLRRPKIETMRVTTDIVYINGRNIFGGDGKDFKSPKDFIKSKMGLNGKGGAAKTGKFNKFSIDDTAGSGHAGMQNGNFSAALGKDTLGDRAAAFREYASTQSITGKLKSRFNLGKDKMPSVFSKFSKEFNFKWNTPDAAKKFTNLRRRMKIMGTRKQRKVIAAVERFMGKHGTVGANGERLGIKATAFNLRDRAKGKLDGLKAQAAEKLSLFNRFSPEEVEALSSRFAKKFNFNWDHPDAQEHFDKIRKNVESKGTPAQRKFLKKLLRALGKGGFRGVAINATAAGSKLLDKVKGVKKSFTTAVTNAKEKKAKKKGGDADGDGLRDGGYREQLRDRAAAAKEFALKLFRRKQVKQGETQNELLTKMLKTLKRTEKNTKEGTSGGGGMLEMLASLAGGAAGGGVLSKIKNIFTGKKATKEVAKQAGKQVVKTAATNTARVGATQVLRTGAMHAGRTALMWAGTAVAGLLGVSAAVVAGAAVAAVSLGVGAYYGYKWFSRRFDVDAIERFRFISYGLNPDEEDQNVAIRYLEDKLEGEVTVKGFKEPITDIIEEYAEDFGIEEDDSEGLHRFAEWLAGRFLPVFTTWTIGAAKLGVDLDDVYDDLERKDYLKLANATFFKADEKHDPYGVSASPFAGKTLATRAQVLEALNALRDGDTDSKSKDDGKADKPLVTGKKSDKVTDGKMKDKIAKEEGTTTPRTPEEKAERKKLVTVKSALGPTGKKDSWTLDEFMDPANMTAEEKAAAIALAADIARLHKEENPNADPIVVPEDKVEVEAEPLVTDVKPRKFRSARAKRAYANAKKRSLQSKRLNYIQKAIAAGKPIDLPEHLQGESSMERTQLDNQARIWRERKANGKVEDREETLPSIHAAAAQQRRSLHLKREEAMQKAKERTNEGRLSPEQYAVQLQERQTRTAVNMDNTLYHMYSILEERLPMPEDDITSDELIAKRNKRLAEMRERNKVDMEDKPRKPPAPVVASPEVNPVSFEKQRQQRY